MADSGQQTAAAVVGKSAKKEKKQKGQKLHLSEFRGDFGITGKMDLPPSDVDWSEAMEEEAPGHVALNEIVHMRKALPSAPMASAGIDYTRIPKQPPFKVKINGIPFDAKEDAVENFFKDISVVSIDLIKSDRGGNRGFGFVTVETADDMIKALEMSDKMVIGNRKIKVDFADNPNQRDGGRGGMTRGTGQRFNQSAVASDGAAADDTNWRRGAKPGGPTQQNGVSGGRDGGGRDFTPRGRSSMSGGFTGSRGGARGEGESSTRAWNPAPVSSSGQSRGSYARAGSPAKMDADMNWRRGGPPRRKTPSPDARRRSVSSSPRRCHSSSRSRSYSRSRSRSGSLRRRRSPSYRSDSRSPSPRRSSPPPRRSSPPPRRSSPPPRRRSPSPRHSPPRRSPSPPRERKRLVLAPRTKPIADSDAPSQSAIFGNAKPVDTAAIERKIEEKLLQERAHLGDKGKDDSGVVLDDRKERHSSYEHKVSPKDSLTRDKHARYSRSSRSSENEAQESRSVDSHNTSNVSATLDNIKLVDAPPPPVNIWEERRQKAAEEAAKYRPSHHQSERESPASQTYSRGAFRGGRGGGRGAFRQNDSRGPAQPQAAQAQSQSAAAAVSTPVQLKDAPPPVVNAWKKPPSIVKETTTPAEAPVSTPPTSTVTVTIPESSVTPAKTSPRDNAPVRRVAVSVSDPNKPVLTNSNSAWKEKPTSVMKPPPANAWKAVPETLKQPPVA